MLMKDHARERIELADFLGGLVGSAVLGQLFDRFDWAACVAGVGAALAVAGILTTRLVLTPPAASPA
jgi:MFS transporter, YNFM family, putative membrane transport protein